MRENYEKNNEQCKQYRKKKKIIVKRNDPFLMSKTPILCLYVLYKSYE